jgi:uncharacterized membrane protein YraQ (UPF0718 family)
VGSLLFMLAMALVLMFLAWRSPRKLLVPGLQASGELVLQNMFRVAMALLAAGFLGQILPQETISHLLGGESGMRGILIAWAIGGFTPGGPILTFPVIVALSKAGAGLPALVTYLTAWSVLGFQRVIMFEWPMMGRRFVINRLIAAFFLPPISGIITLLLEKIWN